MGSEAAKPSAQALESIRACHVLVLDHLKANQEDFYQQIQNGERLTVEDMVNDNDTYDITDGKDQKHSMVYLPYPLFPIAMRRSLIHHVIDLVKDDELNECVAKHFVRLLIEKNSAQMRYGVPQGNGPLDIVVQYRRCLGLLEVLCEYGMEPPVDPKLPTALPKMASALNSWMDVSQMNRDTCLHTAIKGRHRESTLYLLRRIKHDRSTSLMLQHRNQDGLTPLHLAVDYTSCDDDQIKLVEQLIELYPPSLKIEVGRSTPDSTPADDYGAHSVMSAHSASDELRGGEDISPDRSGLSPYRYFLATKHQALESEYMAGQAAARGFPFFFFENSRAQQPSNAHRGCDRMENLLRLSCMRYYGRKRSILTRILPPLLKQIHFDLSPRMEVSRALLDHLSRVTEFEQFLQYVCIPNLRVHGVNMEELEAEPWWQSHSRKDYVYIFEWLNKVMGVTKIVRIMVEDDPRSLHSDEAIERAVSAFDIEEWDWTKPDLCSDTILRAAGSVRDLCLYWSGNKAVLRSWLADDGLVELRQLRILRIVARMSRATMKQVEANFKKEFEAAWDHRSAGDEIPSSYPHVLFEPVNIQTNASKKLSEEEREEKGRKEKWLKSIENFTEPLKTYLGSVCLSREQEIKVGIIDDGLDIDYDNIGRNVAMGETFFDNQGHWPGFYQSAYGHGTLMASLIRQMCPRVKLYIAKLNEVWNSGKSQITAESAAKAIDWAREQGVDIISMSWSIEDPDVLGLQALKEAVRLAVADNILLFCASNDQGNLTDIPYPARISEKNIFKIGSATALGRRDLATSEAVDFIAPGSETAEPARPGDSLGFAEPLSGSSIATARCAGLAALILQCIVLSNSATRVSRQQVRTHSNMTRMLESMVSSKDKDKYLRVWEVFDKSFDKAPSGLNLEWNIINTAATEFLKKVPFLLPAANGNG